jgi:hypothetical protein
MWIVVVVLAAIAMLVSGCGSSSTHASSTSAPVGSSKAITSAQAVALASAINLRQADVPGRVPDARRKEGTRTFLGRCERPAGSGEAAGIPSQAFEENLEHGKRSKGSGILGILSIYPLESVRSAVYTTTSSTLAAHAVAVATGTVGQACLRRSFLQGGRIVSSESKQEPVFTEAKVFPLQVQIGRVQIQGMHDLLGFSSGPHEIFLKVTSSRRDPEATERRLLSLLYNRAKAHRLYASS